MKKLTIMAVLVAYALGRKSKPSKARNRGSASLLKRDLEEVVIRHTQRKIESVLYGNPLEHNPSSRRGKYQPVRSSSRPRYRYVDSQFPPLIKNESFCDLATVREALQGFQDVIDKTGALTLSEYRKRLNYDFDNPIYQDFGWENGDVDKAKIFPKPGTSEYYLDMPNIKRL